MLHRTLSLIRLSDLARNLKGKEEKHEYERALADLVTRVKELPMARRRKVARAIRIGKASIDQEEPC